MSTKPFYFLKAFSNLYELVLKEAARGLRLNLHQYLLQLILSIVTAIILGVLHPVPGLAGALLSGAIFGVFISVYLASVSAAVALERVSARETLTQGMMLFPRVMGVLFVFFLVTLGIHSAVRDNTVHIVANLVLAIMWNAVLESSYQEEEVGLGIFTAAWRFIYANTLEWFIAMAAIAVILFSVMGIDYSVRAVVAFLAVHPLQLLQMLLVIAASPEQILAHVWQAGFLLLVLYPVFIFRGILYKHLARSNRRKRVFEAQF